MIWLCVFVLYCLEMDNFLISLQVARERNELRQKRTVHGRMDHIHWRLSEKCSARSWFSCQVTSHIYIILADSDTYRELGLHIVLKSVIKICYTDNIIIIRSFSPTNYISYSQIDVCKTSGPNIPCKKCVDRNCNWVFQEQLFNKWQLFFKSCNLIIWNIFKQMNWWRYWIIPNFSLLEAFRSILTPQNWWYILA